MDYVAQLHDPDEIGIIAKFCFTIIPLNALCIRRVFKEIIVQFTN